MNKSQRWLHWLQDELSIVIVPSLVVEVALAQNLIQIDHGEPIKPFFTMKHVID